MISYRDAKYLQNSCDGLEIKVSICTLNEEISLHIMDREFFDYLPALRFIQAYQADQGVRWASYKPKLEAVAS